MDFWQFGIYIVILSGATSLVIMTIILIIRKMNEGKPSHERYKSKATATAWAHRPPAKSTVIPQTPPKLGTTEQDKVSNEQVEPGLTSQDSELNITEEASFTSPLSVLETTELTEPAATATLEQTETNSTFVTEPAGVTAEDDRQANEEPDLTENDPDDPLSIFQMEDAQENPISELSASLPDIDVSSLLREGKEILRILGIETQEH